VLHEAETKVRFSQYCPELEELNLSQLIDISQSSGTKDFELNKVKQSSHELMRVLVKLSFTVQVEVDNTLVGLSCYILRT
jgi:hypothetical protein